MLSKNRLKELTKLHQKKYREQTSQYLIEGFHLIEEAIHAKQLDELFVLESVDTSYHVKTTVVSEGELQQLSQTKTPQPIIGLCRKRLFHPTSTHRILVLDSIQDPGNLGTLIRTALGLGFDQIIMSSTCVELWNDKVIRSTQGAHFHIAIKIVDDLVEELKVLSITHDVFVTDLSGSSTINQEYEDCVLVLGNEGNGVSKEILALPLKRIKIEMHNIDSLNVAIAGGILMDRLNR